MSSLRAKLGLAFIAVALLTTALTATFAVYTAHYTFRQYVERRAVVPGPIPLPYPQAGPVSAPGPGMAPAAPFPPRDGQRFGPRERRFVGRFQAAIWGGTFLAALIGAAIALWLANRIVRPVTGLTQAARAISSGTVPPPVPIEGRDEIAELARSFNLMASRLAEDEAQRRRLFAGIAHELRTPLSVIQGTLEGMLDRVVEPTPERLASLHGQALLLSRLIVDLRDLSLAQAGQLQLRREIVDARGPVRDALEGLAPLAEERGVRLETDLPDGLPVVDVDPDRLRQIVQNLAENAVRHTPAGGSVRVGVSANGKGVRLVIADTGEGIDAADLPHIFRHFYRVDSSRARRSGGTGLGLAIVKSLVEAHGGQVIAESVPGHGTTFTVTLPGRPSEAA